MTFQREADAKVYERKLKEEAFQGTLASDIAARKTTFGDFFREWAVTRGSKSISEGWKMGQDQIARDYLLPILEHVKLEDLSSRHVERVLHHADTLKRKPATKRLIFNLLHTILARTVKLGILNKNPATDDLKPQVPKIARHFLKPADLWKLLVASRHHYLGPAIWLASLAGLRCEAIQALKWECVDFDNEQILIKITYKRKTNSYGLPKGKDAEYVPMAAALVEYLRTVKGNQGPDDFVARGKAGGRLDHHVFNDGLRALCHEAGVSRVTPHELRHSCTELFVTEGASIEDLRRLLNHKDMETTEGYMHRTPERLRNLARAIVVPAAPTPARPKLSVVK